MTVSELIAKLQELPSDARVLMMHRLSDGDAMAVPCYVRYWPMEKIQSYDFHARTLELWEDTSVTQLEPGKFEKCVVFDW